MKDEVHYWSGSPATFRAVRKAAKESGQLVCEWVEQAVIERLERERLPKESPAVPTT